MAVTSAIMKFVKPAHGLCSAKVHFNFLALVHISQKKPWNEHSSMKTFVTSSTLDELLCLGSLLQQQQPQPRRQLHYLRLLAQSVLPHLVLVLLQQPAKKATEVPKIFFGTW